MIRAILPVVACAVLGGAWQPAAAGAQQPAPSLSGLVRDEQSRPLPQARITVVRLSRSTTTDSEGRFAFRDLPGGKYRVQVALMGYAPVVRELEAGTATPAEFVLRATPLTLDEIQVTAAPTESEGRAPPPS